MALPVVCTMQSEYTVLASSLRFAIFRNNLRGFQNFFCFHSFFFPPSIMDIVSTFFCAVSACTSCPCLHLQVPIPRSPCSSWLCQHDSKPYRDSRSNTHHRKHTTNSNGSISFPILAYRLLCTAVPLHRMTAHGTEFHRISPAVVMAKGTL